MQTFLPYTSFVDSAKCLDGQRLHKQKVECYQILRTLFNPDPHAGWKFHPAVKQWSGYTNSLVRYGKIITRECLARDYKDTMLEKINSFYDASLPDYDPPWLFNPLFCASHRAALLHKKPEWYSQFGWKETPEIKYWWPTQNGY